MRGLGLRGRIFAADSSRTAPAFHLADAAWQVPPCTAPDFVPTMLELCQREQIRLVVPTIDTELAAYSNRRADFAAIGVAVAVSGPNTIAVAADKVVTHTWLTESGLPTVPQALPEEVLAEPGRWRFPLIAKPRGGSAGMGVICARSVEALRLAAGERDDLVVQEIAPGQEHTVNIYVDKSGRCRCAVPHRRIEVRSGEVSKALTVKHQGLMSLAKQIVEALRDPYGALNIQCFLDDGGVRIIEINPRFGGGYPLAHAAGANFPRWLLQEAAGLPVDAAFDQWQDNLAMLRYDDAVFVPGELIGDVPPAGSAQPAGTGPDPKHRGQRP
jgi:carbamoyl-phosphate synthase large subunit